MRIRGIAAAEAWAPAVRSGWSPMWGGKLPRKLKKRLLKGPFTITWLGAVTCSAPGFNGRISAAL